MYPLPTQQVFQQALRHHQAGELDQAEQIYRQVLARQPEHVGALHYLGVLAHQQGRNEIAVDLIGRAIALGPDAPEPYNNLGLALKASGRPGDAIAAYRQAIALRPEYATAYCNLGIALQFKGQLDEAITAYRRSIAQSPNNVEALTNLGDCLWGARRLDDAIAAYQQAVVIGPGLPEPQRRLQLAREEKLRDRIPNIAVNGTMLRCGGIKYLIGTGEGTDHNGASIITPGGRLLVYRPGDGEEDGLKYLWLDSEGGGGRLPLLWGGGDPRLFRHDGKLIICNNYGGNQLRDRMEIQEVLIDGRDVSTRKIARFDQVPGLELNQREKNWCPFSVEGRLYFEYSLDPHVVLAYDLEKESIEPAFTTTAKQLPFQMDGVGRLRLNVPAVLLNRGDHDQKFLGVFHVAKGRDYYTGFYQFSGRPPFELIAMSKNPVLWPEDSEGIAWRQLGWRVLFIQSLEIDERKDLAVLFGGDNDQACIRIELKLSDILADMGQVT